MTVQTPDAPSRAARPGDMPGAQLLHDAWDHSFVSLGLLSPEGTLLALNQAARATLPPEQAQRCDLKLWDSHWASHDPEKQAWLRDAVRRAALGETVRADLELRSASEGRMMLDFMLAPRREAAEGRTEGRSEGRIAQLVYTGVDVSERLTAQHALRDTQDRYTRVFEDSSLGMVVVNSRGSIVLANAAMAQMFGYDKAEMIGMAVHQLVPERQREGHAGRVGGYMEAPVKRVMAQRQALFALRRDGSEFPIEIALNPMRQNGDRHVLATVSDVTERVAAQRALHDSQDRYSRVFEDSSLGMVVVDGAGAIVLANLAMAQMFGYEKQAMIGMAVHQLVPMRQRPGHAGLVAGYMEAPVRRVMADRQELFALRHDGSEFPIEIALNPMRLNGDRCVLATVSDVTERFAARQKLEGALREKTVLLNEVHHRVKNNLQVISSLLNLQGRNAAPIVQAALRDSQSRVRSMALMHQLLYERNDFSALDLGPYLQRLGKLLRETYLSFGNNNIQLLINAPAAGLRIDLQRAVPCGLLVNELVTNAIKHGFPEGRKGRIEVTVALQEPDSEGGPGRALVDVSDDGVGMPAEPPKTRGLGFQLLPLLAEQCGSKLEPMPPPGPDGSGTHFRLMLQLDPTPVGEEDHGRSH